MKILMDFNTMIIDKHLAVRFILAMLAVASANALLLLAVYYLAR